MGNNVIYHDYKLKITEVISDKLQIGGFKNAQNKELIDKLKITHILSCCNTTELNYDNIDQFWADNINNSDVGEFTISTNTGLVDLMNDNATIDPSQIGEKGVGLKYVIFNSNKVKLIKLFIPSPIYIPPTSSIQLLCKSTFK